MRYSCGCWVLLQVLFFSESLVPTARKALCDPLEEVREAAAKTFEQLHSTIGHQALEDILPFLLKQLVSGAAWPLSVGFCPSLRKLNAGGPINVCSIFTLDAVHIITTQSEEQWEQGGVSHRNGQAMHLSVAPLSLCRTMRTCQNLPWMV